MQKYFGHALKAVAFHTGSRVSRGEAILSEQGLEGGGIYCLGPELRHGAALQVDLHPNLTTGHIEQRLTRPRGKAS